MLRRDFNMAMAATMAAPMIAHANHTGPFDIGYSTTKVQADDERMNLWIYKPFSQFKGILFVHHGTNRDPWDYRRRSVPLANDRGLLIVCPEYDSPRFTTSDYQRGNMDNGSDGTLWTARYTKAIVEHVRSRERKRAHLPTWLFGFSAGGQHLSRICASQGVDNHRISGINAIISGGASTYVWPTVGTPETTDDAAYGFDSLVVPGHSNASLLDAYLQYEYRIIIGLDDNDPNDPDLAHGAEADAQGTDRLARARACFSQAQTTATNRGVTLQWEKYEVAGVGHSSVNILKCAELQQAMGLENPVALP